MKHFSVGKPVIFNLKYLKRFGMCPHETCQERILCDNRIKILKMIEEYMREFFMANEGIENVSKNKKDVNYPKLIMEFVRIYYSNPSSPQHINIIDNDPSSDYYLLYGGKKFINDVLSKSARNQRILQVIYFQLNEFANGFNIPPIVTEFIQNELLPHITRCYFTKSYNALLQQIWQENNDLISQIGEIPPCQFSDTIRIDNQLTDMKKKTEYMHDQHNLFEQMEIDKIIHMINNDHKAN